MVNPLKAVSGMVASLLPVGPGTVLPIAPKIPDIGSFIASLGAALEGLLGVSRASEENIVAEGPVDRKEEESDEGLEFAPVEDLRLRAQAAPESPERARAGGAVPPERPDLPASHAQEAPEEEPSSRPTNAGTPEPERAPLDGGESGPSEDTPPPATLAPAKGLSAERETASLPSVFIRASGQDPLSAAEKGIASAAGALPAVPGTASAQPPAAAAVIPASVVVALSVPAGSAGGGTPAALAISSTEAAAIGERVGPAAPAAGGDASGLSGFRSFGDMGTSRLPSAVPGAAPEDRAEFIDRIVKAARLTQTRGAARIRLALDPPRLGHVRVDLSLEKHTLQATFRTESPAAKEAILANADALRSALEDQGIHVGDLQVQVDSAFGQASQDAPRAGTQGPSSSHRGEGAAESVAVPERGEGPRALSARVQLIDVMA